MMLKQLNWRIVANAKLIVDVDGTKYNAKTNKNGNYNINVTTKTNGTKIITVTYKQDGINTSVTNFTTFKSNKKLTYLTLGSSKSAYVGDSLSVYGKLTVDGVAIENAIITIKVGDKTYKATTSQYGNYNLNVSSSQSGNFTITATYAGTNIYSTAVNTTTFLSNMKVTTLTAGSTSTANVGDKISVSGRITARNIGLQYANLTVTVGDKTYNVVQSYFVAQILALAHLTYFCFCFLKPI